MTLSFPISKAGNDNRICLGGPGNAVMHGAHTLGWAGPPCLRLRAQPPRQRHHHYLSPGHSPWQLWRSAASCMPGPHSHTNPPSVFTHWPSQEALRHSSMSAKRESILAQTTLHVVCVQGKKSDPTRTLSPSKACLQQGGNHHHPPTHPRKKDQAPPGKSSAMREPPESRGRGARLLLCDPRRPEDREDG